jgi:uncharacterized repeat protein (TIGR03803 family)
MRFIFANKVILAIAITVVMSLGVAQAQTFQVLHQFNGSPSGNGLSDGANPEGALTLDAAGNLFGTTFTGGGGQGVVFKIDKKGKETVFFTFQGSNGEDPRTPLLLDAAGNLYGIADGGPGAGMVFKISPKGEETQLIDFQGGLHTKQPGVPTGGILMDKAGNIFGTTFFGGSSTQCTFSCGSLFRLDAAGKLHVLHNFSGRSDGSRPFGPLVQDAAGNLFGVAQQGGDVTCPGFPSERFPEVGCGVVFKISKKRVFTVLHAFAGGNEGAIPQAGLLMDAAGNLYGTTFTGGSANNGTVFKISSAGTFTILHQFTGTDGANPNGGLVADAAGNLYGTAQMGGTDIDGTAWVLSPAGQFKVLHDFIGLEDGAFPSAGLIIDAAGNLYGTTVSTGLIQRVQGGNVFKITP